MLLKGLQPKTIDGYARAIRRIGTHFDHQVTSLLLQQLADCFTAMKAQHSWRGVKLDLYGLNGEQPAESGQRAAHPGAGDCRTRHQKNISAQPAPRPRHAPD